MNLDNGRCAIPCQKLLLNACLIHVPAMLCLLPITDFSEVRLTQKIIYLERSFFPLKALISILYFPVIMSILPAGIE